MEISWDKIIRLIRGQASDSEKKEIADWARKEKHRKKFLKDAFEFYSKEDIPEISYQEIQKAWNKVNPVKIKRRKYFLYTSAAAVVLIGFSLLSYNGLFKIENNSLPHIKPGEERANLMLAGEKRIELDSKTKNLAENISVVKESSSNKATLIIDVKGRTSEQLLQFSEITVPKYAEYQINLEEGTKVWLNSETKLRFPLKFADKERVVYVSGEAYFQVAHNPDKPFIVHIDDNTKIKVLGTEFNIRTYDEQMPESTLISGSIEFIHNGVTTVVNPGESCILNKTSGTVNVREADVMKTIAWKNGEFVFRNERLDSIVTELSRWYNVDVKFENEAVKNERFYLYFDRSTGFEEIIYQINKTGKINYKYENKSIIIY